MRLQFKHQKFQADAAKAVVDVFSGQPYRTSTYRVDRGDEDQQTLLDDFTGWRNEPIVPELNDGIILEHLQKVREHIGQGKDRDGLEDIAACEVVFHGRGFLAGFVLLPV